MRNNNKNKTKKISHNSEISKNQQDRSIRKMYYIIRKKKVNCRMPGNEETKKKLQFIVPII